jgi:hypothetical protein
LKADDRNLLRAFALACLGLVGVVACAVDDRPLHRRPQIYFGDAGAEGGEGGQGNPVRTWTFDDGTQDWSPEAGIEQRFGSDDAAGDKRSGSLLLTHTLVAGSDEYELGGTMQCLPVTGDTVYRLSAKTFVPKDQGPGGSGFIMAYFNADDCQGLQLDLLNYASDKTGVWSRAQKTRLAPAGTKSVLLRLVVTKVWRLPSFDVAFDDVVLSEF